MKSIKVEHYLFNLSVESWKITCSASVIIMVSLVFNSIPEHFLNVMAPFNPTFKKGSPMTPPNFTLMKFIFVILTTLSWVKEEIATFNSEFSICTVLWLFIPKNIVNERNHGFGFETEETKVVSVSTETNFGFLLTETH